MRAIVQVALDNGERHVMLDRVYPNIGVGHDDKDYQDHPLWRACRSAVDGQPLNAERLSLLIDGVRHSIATCREQSDPEWWHDNVVPYHTGTGAASPGGISLVANPPQFCIDMAAQRGAQARALQEGLDVLERARNLLWRHEGPDGSLR